MNSRSPFICEFCDKLEKPPPEWYDFHIVSEGSDFVAVASLGALTPGMLLIVSRAHVPSMAALDSRQRSSLYAFEGRLSAVLEDTWSRPLVFEHGSSPARTAGYGPCIDHAHWHLAPGMSHLEDPAVRLDEASSFEQVAELRHGKPYIAWRDLAGGWRSGESVVPGQYFRRLIARQLGRPDEWDYLAFPMLENVRETITRLTGRNAS